MNKPITDIFPTYTENDFESLIWHDVTIHAMAFGQAAGDLFFDVDHIEKWTQPDPPSGAYQFYVVPATLVFRSVWNIEAEVCSYSGECQIDGISRQAVDVEPAPDPRVPIIPSWKWTISLTTGGEIVFRSNAFDLYYRRDPVLNGEQVFSLEERGGFSFSLERVSG